MPKETKPVFLLTSFSFSYSFIHFQEYNANLEQDFKPESIELFEALQKHRKNTKIGKNNSVKLRTLFSRNMFA